MILCLKTDSPVCELILVTEAGDQYDDSWEAGRSLSEGLLGFIEDCLSKQDVHWHDLTGVVVFRGPGSFTGLRIGITVANTIAYARNIPIVGAMEGSWIRDGVKKLKANEDDRIVLPEYGRPARITEPRK